MRDLHPMWVDSVCGREVLAPTFRDQVVHLVEREFNNEGVIFRVQRSHDLVVAPKAREAKGIATAQFLNLERIEKFG